MYQGYISLAQQKLQNVRMTLCTVAGLTCVMRVNFLPSPLHLFSKAARAKCALFGLLLDTTCHTDAVVQDSLVSKQSLCAMTVIIPPGANDRTPTQVKGL
jgi:hypothetical protein